MPLRMWKKESEDPKALAEAGEEVWATVENTAEYYYVSNLGRFASRKTRRRDGVLSPKARILKGSHGQAGYVMYTIFGIPGKEQEKQNILAQRLVLLHFVGDPPTVAHTDARHLNGEKTDNRVPNLAWGTRSENMLDVWAHRQQGKPSCTSLAQATPNPTYELDDRLVGVGLEFYFEDKLSINDLGRLWDCSREVATAVVKGKTWKHVPRPEAPKKQKRRSATRRKEILALLGEGKSRAEVNEALGETLTCQDIYYYRSKLPKET